MSAQDNHPARSSWLTLPRERSHCPPRALLAVLLLLLPAGRALGQPAAEPIRAPAPEIPGALFICGGGELPAAVRDHFVQLAGGPRARIVVIPTASRKADTPEGIRVLLPWKGLKVASVVLLHTRSRAQANDPGFLRPLTEATGVWIAGGDQKLLTAAYLGTAVLDEIKKVLARGGVVGGTSAGAAVMSRVMIAGGSQRPEIDVGFGLLAHVIVDQHFQQRNRLGRLQAALAEHPELVGLGVDEETAVVVRGGTLTVLGNFSACACLAPAAGQPASLQMLGAGKQADLLALSRMAQARARPAAAQVRPSDPALPRGTLTSGNK